MDEKTYKPRLRTQKKTNSKEETTVKPQKKKKNKSSKRKFNILALTLLLISFALIFFIVGSMIGFGMLGKKNPLEVFNIETWTHMYNLIFG